LKTVDGRMNPERVREILKVKTYGLTAINPGERMILINIIRKELERVAIKRGMREDEF